MNDESQNDENKAGPSKKQTKDRPEDDSEDREGDSRSYSRASASVASSVRSVLTLRANVRPDAPKPALVKKAKPEKKKRKVRRGRVSKRRRSPNRQYYCYTRRVSKRKPKPIVLKNHEASVSTIFSRTSSRSGSISCKYCGHSCCDRRYTKLKRKQRRILVRIITNQLKILRRKEEQEKRRKLKQRRKRKPHVFKVKDNLRNNKHSTVNSVKNKKTQAEKATSTGSAPKEYLNNQRGSEEKKRQRPFKKSPLLEKGTAEDKTETDEEKDYCEITPEMIHEAVRSLQMWRQYIRQESILIYIKSKYPVNQDEEQLQDELADKLEIAAIVGILTKVRIRVEDHWCLSCALLNRELPRTHVTLFWKIYGDTMTPIMKRAYTL